MLFDWLKVWIASAAEKPSGIFWGNRTKCLNKINIPRFLHWTLSSFVQFPRQHGTLFYFLKKSHIFVCLMRINDQLYIPWRVTNFLFAQMKKYVGGCNTEYDSINANLSSKKNNVKWQKANKVQCDLTRKNVYHCRIRDANNPWWNFDFEFRSGKNELMMNISCARLEDDLSHWQILKQLLQSLDKFVKDLFVA